MPQDMDLKPLTPSIKTDASKKSNERQRRLILKLKSDLQNKNLRTQGDGGLS